MREDSMLAACWQHVDNEMHLLHVGWLVVLVEVNDYLQTYDAVVFVLYFKQGHGSLQDIL